ncbi:hypothetical protein EDD57_1324 [Baia soyae]|uniref:Uncharacterized protein n=1 Tax=Baia soyae TaxID=1544746 RepID=A0A4V2SXE0_9BACL|nr:hypothetical protein EDD57_1324 [Baia soyae]
MRRIIQWIVIILAIFHTFFAIWSYNHPEKNNKWLVFPSAIMFAGAVYLNLPPRNKHKDTAAAKDKCK